MADTKLTTRLPPNVQEWLKARAKANHRSANGELVAILERAMTTTAKGCAQ